MRKKDLIINFIYKMCSDSKMYDNMIAYKLLSVIKFLKSIYLKRYYNIKFNMNEKIVLLIKML